MVNTKLLKEKINSKGLKLNSLAAQLGITYRTFKRKIENDSDFKLCEVAQLSLLLELTQREAEEIFFTFWVIKNHQRRGADECEQ